MIGRIAFIFSVLVLLASPAPADAADNSAAAELPDILVLRNGELLEGRITRQDDRYVVSLTDGEIRLSVHEVDFLCHSLQEAYDVQSRRITGQRIEDRLHLASWCLRHNLTGPAAQELAAAMAIDPNDVRVAVLDRRLQEMLHPTQESESAEAEPSSAGSPDASPETSSSPKLPAGVDDLERMARNLPRGAMESYSTTILPLLLNHCATAGCHSVGTQSKFVLLRPSPGSPTARRLTLRDLHNTLDWVDYETPAKSKLLSTAKAAHATCTAPAIEKEESREYQQLVAWVMLATQGDKNPAPPARPATISLRPASKPNPPQASEQSTVTEHVPLEATVNPSPAGAGWANAISPSGKVPIHTAVPASGTSPTAPAASKSIRPVPPGPAAAAQANEGNAKSSAGAAATP